MSPAATYNHDPSPIFDLSSDAISKIGRLLFAEAQKHFPLGDTFMS